ncbi:N-acetylglucosamine-6-phosphate deacetylase [Actinopolyspora erythraea]|uniref:N-acetylglucosamine-6-phosphate deacetylase n=1 Tax=Actinopolyspora erythraea TaxID=414996 RepID=A0A099DBI3_9ACTN|nr:N-acetylglucosamine-6-phosphate deacetylase [Actinopolyspora erythraea]ASU80554.1 N-acetylglucosamine-6-phosphate deacetylase [Actinopolyspora erythraea]KGI82770.1 N-acetylglucosamine-6-phosphate deacetylase [Actinopolyspora erythraea]
MSNEATAPSLIGGRIVTDEGAPRDGWIRIERGRIAEIGEGPVPGGAPDLDGRWIVPGFVDIHCHGGGGGSLTSRDQHQISRAVDAHRAHGTTTMLASLVTASIPQLREQIESLLEPVAAGQLAGIHLEGPFLSAVRCGAHDTDMLRPPDPETVTELLEAGRGAVRMVTLAPELDGAVEAVKQLSEAGVIAAVGHTDAVAEQVRPAVEAGATVATHLFNGMRPLHHREPGPVGTLLDDERITVELICDMVHLHPTVARLVARHAGPARTVAVTDAISATEAGDGHYELGSLPLTVTNGEPRLADGSLAGSTLTMDTALRNLVERCGLSLPEAVAACATKPAELLGLSDRLGSIRPGLEADLVVLDEGLRPRHVLKSGSVVSGNLAGSDPAAR